MADRTCSCFWPSSHIHASQHTDGNTTVFKTHSGLFEKFWKFWKVLKKLHMFYNVKNERTCWQLVAVFSLYLSWLLNRSLNHRCIAHTPALVTDLTVHFSCLFFGWGYIEIPVVLTSQCLIVGLCVSVGLTDSPVVVWRWSGLLLRPALSLPFCFFSFLFLSTYFYQSYSWTPSGNDM